MISNELALNKEKTNVMIISKDITNRENFIIKIKDKEIKHSNNMIILGNKLNDKLNWDSMLTNG